MLSIDAYFWIKAVHVIAVISWMAGLLYLPRLFVYHTQVAADSETSDLFKVMERRLLKGIMTPALVASWIPGLVMAVDHHLFTSPWFHVKLLAVVAMTGVHVFLDRLRVAFAENRNSRSQRFFRILNEVPTLLMIAIVILVIVQPGFAH